MVEPTARIRPFKAEDEKLAKFTIGKANMEGLTTANTKSEWIQRYLRLQDLLLISLAAPFDYQYMGCAIMHLDPVYAMVA